MRGEAAGHELLDFLANSARFEQYVRGTWHWRLRTFLANSLDKTRIRMYVCWDWTKDKLHQGGAG